MRELAQRKRERALEAESGPLEGTGLTEEELKALFGQMLLVRRFEEEVEQAYRRGRIGGYAHVYIGQEAVATGFLAHRRPGDLMFTGYRDHAHALLLGTDPGAVMAELFGKVTGVSKGKGGSMHLFLENASLYPMKGEVPEEDSVRPLKGARVVRPGTDVTIVSYSRMLHLALAAAQQLAGEGIEAEVIDLRVLRPLDLDPVIASVERTHRAVVIQEQWKPFGAAAEIAAAIYERGFEQLDAPVERVTGADVPMPYARDLELLAVPHEADVVAAVQRALYGKPELVKT